MEKKVAVEWTLVAVVFSLLFGTVGSYGWKE
jgi:hypothetical protein